MVEWKEQDKDNFIGLYKNYILRVEQMGPQKWWWAVYKDRIKAFTSSIHTVFGTAMHEAIQKYLDVMYLQ